MRDRRAARGTRRLGPAPGVIGLRLDESRLDLVRRTGTLDIGIAPIEPGRAAVPRSPRSAKNFGICPAQDAAFCPDPGDQPPR